jgi:ABC-2 type transport system permease protein
MMTDTLTMLRRVTTHMQRNAVYTLMGTLATPILMLVMMYNLFGGVVQSAGTTGGSYIDFLTPGLIVITTIYGMGTATLRVNADMTQGIITRFRTMSIARSAVLNGHVLGSTVGTLLSVGVVVTLAVLTGFRPTAGVAECVAAFAIVLLLVLGMNWLAVAVGVSSKSPEVARNMLFILYILPFLSSAFVPPTSMTPVMAWIAENQPFSPIIDTVRGLLLGTPVGSRGWVAVAWCVAFAVVGYVWALASYNRSTNH